MGGIGRRMKRYSCLQRLVIAFLFTAAPCTILTPECCAGDIGSKVANFVLPDYSGENWSLRAHSGKIIALIFWSFKCPVSLSYDRRLEDLRSRYEPKGIVLVGIDSNSNESTEEVQANLINRKMSLPVLLDTDGMVAEKLGATHAPSVFIIDGQSVLRYRGALDNGKKPGDIGRIPYVEDALNSLLADKAVPTAETTPLGCALRQGRSAPGR
jgi:peroxiredoxin